MSSEHVEDLLPELALGTLPQAQHQSVEAHLSECAACRAQLAKELAAVDALAEAIVKVTPRPDVLGGIQSSLKGGGRFGDFTERLAKLFDFTVQRAQELLARIDDPGEWMEGPAEGITLLPVEAGPGAQNALTALVRMAPGSVFPAHTHLGLEHHLILQGGYLEQGGAQFWPGEELIKQPGTTHELRALDGLDCISASRLEGGLDFLPGVKGS